MMRAWKSRFHFGGLCAALALSSTLGMLGTLGCVAAPAELEEETAVAESALAPDGPELDLDSDEDLGEPTGSAVTEPEPHPWRPPPALWTSDGPGAPDAEDTDAEPEPHPWDTAVDGSDGRYIRPGTTR